MCFIIRDIKGEINLYEKFQIQNDFNQGHIKLHFTEVGTYDKIFVSNEKWYDSNFNTMLHWMM